ncbi:hypothetical protein CN692_04520 [Bacillus sp. AFS002410]|uniref:CDP-glycerol glycerophosphotransferase family protein n=1 Tax=Bacillus sp. AFS002410 TaxID=2033481 RepID=UPI000BF06EAC|nr:CDP-glycerol glycerophosphotransferase family protein [Bacillus sp. AFS002410]PEJ59465.1 hypothetical protein CN692_04520 [Bacillus sp. AFS002410]
MQKAIRALNEDPKLAFEEFKKFIMNEEQVEFDIFHLINIKKKNIYIEDLYFILKDTFSQYDLSQIFVYDYVFAKLILQKEFKEAVTFSELINSLDQYTTDLDYSIFKIKKINTTVLFTFSYGNELVEVDISDWLEKAHFENQIIDIEKLENKLVIRGNAFFQGINLINDEDIEHQLIIKDSNNKSKTIQIKRARTNYFNSSRYNYCAGGYEFHINLDDFSNVGNYDVTLETVCYGRVIKSKLKYAINVRKNYQFNNNLTIVNKKLKLNLLHKSHFSFKIEPVSFVNSVIKNVITRSKEKKILISRFFHNPNNSTREKINFAIIIIFIELFGYTIGNRKFTIISEKLADSTNDNGFAFFQYCRESSDASNIYYLLRKDAKNYNEIKKLGNVIPYNGFKHFLFSIFAKTIISTDNVKILIPKELRDISHANLVFIGHGVTLFKKVDHVYHASRGVANQIIVSTDQEKEIFIRHFGYEPNNVFVTGLPRTSYLMNHLTEKVILVMFTWRTEIKSKEDFLQSEFFYRLKGLLLNKELLKKLESNNVSLKVLVHPRMIEYVDLMPKLHNRIILEKLTETDVKQAIENSSMLITDYSSILFDFIYLKKPIIMYGFDYFNANYSVSRDYMNSTLADVFFETEKEVLQRMNKYIEEDFILDQRTYSRYLHLVNSHQNSVNLLYDVLENKM